ncbi:MAG: PLP-dependent aminotransferase family protein, partial [Solirubrobacteraceae bacterium]
MDLHLDLDHAPGRSLRARVENAMRDAIRSGLLAPDLRLPSTRVLAVQLGVSRGVIVDAYAQLAAEGYLHARAGAGTTVASVGTTGGAGARQPVVRALVPSAPAVAHDLSPFVPALDAFPRKAWGAALSRVLRGAPDERLGLPAGAGVPELRAALASYLARVRGVRASPEQVVVCNGLRQGLGLLWSTLGAAGARRVGVEDPGWRGVAETATDAALATAGVPVDEQGISVGHLAAQRARIDAVAVAPAHQYPTGAVLSPGRRAALVQWAQDHDAVIVEDDYDAEYRYDRDPVGSLQGLAPEQVVYCGSTSKSLAPAVRLAWLVVPARLVEPMSALQARRGGMPAGLEQLALAELIE